jgi:hypothetical protein
MGFRPHVWGRAPVGLLRASWVVLATLLFGLGAAGGSSGGDFKGGGLRLSGLKGWRVRRGLSQGELAKLVGVPRHYVQRIEQDRRGDSRTGGVARGSFALLLRDLVSMFDLCAAWPQLGKRPGQAS